MSFTTDHVERERERERDVYVTPRWTALPFVLVPTPFSGVEIGTRVYVCSPWLLVLMLPCIIFSAENGIRRYERVTRDEARLNRGSPV